MTIFDLMSHSRNKSAQWLTYAIALLALAATLSGILIPTLYRDNPVIKTAWLGNDIVTLVLTPLLLHAFHQSKKGSHKATLLWLGLVAYMFYNYAFYLFGAAFNAFFLIYVALFTLSFYALFLGVIHLNVHAMRDIGAIALHRSATVVFLLLVALPLATVELRQVFIFLFKGRAPEIPILVLTLDLAFIIPNTILSAILLWKKNIWGNVLAAIMLVKSFTYGLVLIAGTALIGFLDRGQWDPLLPYYVFICAGGLILLLPLLKDKEPALRLGKHKLKVRET